MGDDRGAAFNFDSRLSHFAGGGVVPYSSSGFGVGTTQSGAGVSTPPVSSSSSSLVFTLPISCQICLSKVKDPVICANRHVFCKSCMDVWLQRNTQCPACRTQIDEGNPLRSVLGGLSVTDEADDDNDNDDVEKAKAARNSKKNLRKARIELLFNEYEEEIQDLREELKDVNEKNGRNEDELRDVKEALAAAKKAAQGHASGNGSTSATTRDPNTTALLAELTAKLQEANDTYSKVLKDVDALKKENAALKEEKESLGFEVNRLRSRLQLRSPAKMGRYATVAMETEVASARKETERLKKALAQADANVEKMQREQDHLRRFHGPCRDANCPSQPSVVSPRGTASTAFETSVESRREAGDVDDAVPRVALNSSTLSLPDSPSTTLGFLSLRSPSTTTAPSRVVAPPNASKCTRNLFAAQPSKGRKTRETSSSSSGAFIDGAFEFDSDASRGGGSSVERSASSAMPSAAPSSTSASSSVALSPATAATGAAKFSSVFGSEDLDDSGRFSLRFSLPSTSSAALIPTATSTNGREGGNLGDEEEKEEDTSEVDVSLEPDVQDCLSLMRAAERKILSRSAASNEKTRIAANLPSAFPSSSTAASSSSSSTSGFHSAVDPSAASTTWSTHSRSSSAATDSTVISLAFSSDSSSAASWTRDDDVGADAWRKTCASADGTLPVATRFPADSGSSRVDQRSLKREISHGELPSKKNPKH